MSMVTYSSVIFDKSISFPSSTDHWRDARTSLTVCFFSDLICLWLMVILNSLQLSFPLPIFFLNFQ